MKKCYLPNEVMPSEYKVTAVVTETIKKALEQRAKQENRSLSNLVSTIIKNEVESWLPQPDRLALSFLTALAQGEQPQEEELAQLAQSLDLEPQQLQKICDCVKRDRPSS